MKTGIGYKLFEMNLEGKLFPLFIGKTKETKMNEWLHAEHLLCKGFSVRSGWHAGTIPSAPWLMSADGTYKSQRSKYWKRVWCEVEYNTNYDYTDDALKQKKKCFEHCPENGYYLFREVGDRIWVITSDIKVNRILDENERKQILEAEGFDEAKEFEPYRLAMMKRMKKGA